MDPVEIVPLLIPVSYFVALTTEALWPARRFPPRRGWRWLGVAFLVLIGMVGATVPLLLPLDWMAAHRWIDGTPLGVAGGTLVGWLVLSFVTYLYHRTSHAWSPLQNDPTRNRLSGLPFRNYFVTSGSRRGVFANISNSMPMSSARTTLRRMLN